MEPNRLGANPLEINREEPSHQEPTTEVVLETPGVTTEEAQAEDVVVETPVEDVSDKTLVEITYEKALQKKRQEHKSQLDDMIKGEMGEPAPQQDEEVKVEEEEPVAEAVDALTQSQYENLKQHFGQRVDALEKENAELGYQTRRDNIELSKLREDVEALLKENVELQYSTSKFDDETLFFSNINKKIKENPEDQRTINKAIDYLSLKAGDIVGIDPQFVKKAIQDKLNKEREEALGGISAMSTSSRAMTKSTRVQKKDYSAVDPTKIRGFKGVPGKLR